MAHFLPTPARKQGSPAPPRPWTLRPATVVNPEEVPLDEEAGVEQLVGLLDYRAWKRLREGYGDANPFFEKADAFTLDNSGALRSEWTSAP